MKIKKIKRKFDKDFPIEFCPVCGSDDIQTSGKTNKKETWEVFCNQCGWGVKIIILRKWFSDITGEDFKFRLDKKDCKECRKEEEEWAKKGGFNEIEVIVD